MSTLLKQYQKLISDNPKLRAVEAAKTLGVSEAQLLNAQVGQGVARLDDNQIPAILKNLKRLGYIMALTRNGSVVNEIKGVYDKLYISEHQDKTMGIAINPGGIDMRLFIHNWRSVFSVETDSYSSIQFFDAYGQAVHKVFTTAESDLNAFLNLRERFKLTEALDFSVDNATEQVNEADRAQWHIPSEQQTLAFTQAWSDLNDVHHFPNLLREFKLARLQALELAGEPWSAEVIHNVLETVLTQARDKRMEIMAFVGNHGAVQIFSGTVQNLKQVGPWFNVLDERFNLHVKIEQISRAFVVRKPTDNGNTIVSSIEFFDKMNNTVLTLFGRRAEGNTQSSEWQALCDKLIQSKREIA
ncbi:hemin-degrading factor [Pseudoalteromonas aurantia]|uniref:Hemin transport protein n=1 Tax=Pseudoalteromonas aurantia 208 TaxID=1314867 RepID=A0ABR9EHV1_9GAMM|nr:ChuX/HutX family heme-like substrate-binding protein [Pseudoalteromonas aurantia]MBE0370588.1 putative hemin transport protein [Pseudoalteromonas aurantia 208]